MALQGTGTMTRLLAFNHLLTIEITDVKLVQVNETRHIRTSMRIMTSTAAIPSSLYMQAVELETDITDNLALIVAFEAKGLLTEGPIGHITIGSF